MKKWQLHNVINDTVIAESNEYMELDEIREKKLQDYSMVGAPLIDYCEDSSKGDIKGKWLICNEKSKLFQKHKNKGKN